MKKETGKKKKLLKEIKSNIGTIIILIISIIIILMLTCNLPKIPGFLTNSSYPEETYTMLEDEIPNILIDDKYIDLEKLSDKSMEYSIDYYLPDNESASNWKIELKKENISVYATIIKSSNNKLVVEKVERSMTQSEYEEMVKDNEEVKKFINILGIIISILIFIAILFYSLDIFYKIKEYRQFQKSK